MTKPKGKTPSLLSKSNGKPTSNCSSRKAKCCRCSSDILSGKIFFSIPQDSGGFIAQKPFCLICFDLIIKKTKEDLLALERELEKHQNAEQASIKV